MGRYVTGSEDFEYKYPLGEQPSNVVFLARESGAGRAWWELHIDDGEDDHLANPEEITVDARFADLLAPVRRVVASCREALVASPSRIGELVAGGYTPDRMAEEIVLQAHGGFTIVELGGAAREVEAVQRIAARSDAVMLTPLPRDLSAKGAEQGRALATSSEDPLLGFVQGAPTAKGWAIEALEAIARSGVQPAQAQALEAALADPSAIDPGLGARLVLLAMDLGYPKERGHAALARIYAAHGATKRARQHERRRASLLARAR